jgi:hypothetical protein
VRSDKTIMENDNNEINGNPQMPVNSGSDRGGAFFTKKAFGQKSRMKE